MSGEVTHMAAGLTAGHEKRRVALTSVGAAIVLTAMKVIVGLMTGSLGLLAEAAHSGIDLVAALITYFAVRFSDRPADAEHHYGHGKIENLSALAETVLLLVTCGWIIYEAVERLFFKQVEVEATLAAFGVIVISIIIDISRSRALLKVARKHGSQALEADALHFSTDVWSSAVVLVGLGLVKLGEYTGHGHVLQRGDAVAALIVAVIVIWVSLKLGRRTVDALLDRAPTGLTARVARAIRQLDGVLECRQLRLRPSGNQTFVDLTIGVRRGLSLETSHEISRAAEARVQAELPHADVVVHVEPVCDAGETLSERIRAIAVNQGQTVHNILVSEEHGRLFMELHIEVDGDMDLRQAHADADRLEAALHTELPNLAAVTTHIEPRRERGAASRDITHSSEELVRQVREIVAGTPGVTACHDVALRRAGGELFLSMHCTFEPGLPVRAVHDISSELENRLRAAIPGLARVTTHPEPADAGEAADSPSS